VVLYLSTISERLVIALEICNVKGSILVSHCSLSDRKDREERQLSLIFELKKSLPFGVPSVLHLEISVPHTVPIHSIQRSQVTDPAEPLKGHNKLFSALIHFRIYYLPAFSEEPWIFSAQ